MMSQSCAFMKAGPQETRNRKESHWLDRTCFLSPHQVPKRRTGLRPHPQGVDKLGLVIIHTWKEWGSSVSPLQVTRASSKLLSFRFAVSSGQHPSSTKRTMRQLPGASSRHGSSVHQLFLPRLCGMWLGEFPTPRGHFSSPKITQLWALCSGCLLAGGLI